MNIYSLLSYSATIAYLYLGIYALRLDTKSRLNRVFFLLSLSFIIWAFSYTFLYPAKDKETCWLWYRIGSIGWCFFAGIMLHFFLMLTKNPSIKKWWIYPILYVPGIVCLLKSLTGVLLVSDFILIPLGWAFVIPLSSAWVWLFYFYYSTYVLISILLCKRWGEKSSVQREKKQVRVIMITTIFSLVFGSLVDVILPALKVYILPPIAIVFVLIWAFGIWYAIVKYRLMLLSPKIAINEIASIMGELLILTDSYGKIIKINPKTKELLGYNENELISQHLEMIILEKDWIKDELVKIREGLSTDCELSLKTQAGETIPIQARGMQIMDEEKNTIGIVIIGEDLRKAKNLESAHKKLEIFHNFLSGNLMVSLTNIEGFCYALLKYHSEGLDSQTKDTIERILERCKEVNHLIENFLKNEIEG